MARTAIPANSSSFCSLLLAFPPRSAARQASSARRRSRCARSSRNSKKSIVVRLPMSAFSSRNLSGITLADSYSAESRAISMGKRSDYSGKGGRYNLMQDVPAGVQKSTGLQATWNDISEFKSELQQAVERGERITQSMLSPTAVPTASRDKQGIVFAWRDSINKLITPRMFHPGIDGITSWRADRGGSATPARLVGGPAIVPAYAGATLAEQVNDGRLAVRCLSDTPPIAGETLGCSGTLTA